MAVSCRLDVVDIFRSPGLDLVDDVEAADFVERPDCDRFSAGVTLVIGFPVTRGFGCGTWCSRK